MEMIYEALSANLTKTTKILKKPISEKLGFAYRPFINSEEEKVVKPGDWQYRINKYNFREPWNFEAHTPKIGFFGCSFTFGEGIEYPDTFVNIVGTGTLADYETLTLSTTAATSKIIVTVQGVKTV
jgi:hypothetical protein